MHITSRTDIGKVREINEDFVFISPFAGDDLSLVILADGMGGHLAGEIASADAVNSIATTIMNGLGAATTAVEYPSLVEAAINNANSEIYTQSHTDDKLKGMGTTIVLALVAESAATIGHIGDSRAYLFSEDELKLKTSDHTLVNELFINEKITREEARNHPQKNVLTRALGTDAEVKIDIIEVNWKQGDIILLCSDGLSNNLTFSDLEYFISEYQDCLEKLADKLIAVALENGGEDNISLILVKNQKSVKTKCGEVDGW